MLAKSSFSDNESAARTWECQLIYGDVYSSPTDYGVAVQYDFSYRLEQVQWTG